MSDLPVWPAKLTREQQKSTTQRRKDFNIALKHEAREAGWRFARSDVFRRMGDWFFSMSSYPLWERGAGVRMMVKPMALDPLFWSIVGLSENEKLPLSFRATGAPVLRPPSIDDHVGLSTTDVRLLAAEVLKWGNQRASDKVKGIAIGSMLATLSTEEHLHGHNRALAICLHILANDLDGAARLCQIDDSGVRPRMNDSGGFTTQSWNGPNKTFIDQARDWIASNR